MTAGVDIVNIARTQLGFVEGPNNENPYGTWYGIPNESYCAMGISWCFAQANASHLVAAQTPKGFSYCPAGLTWFQKNKRIVDKYSGLPGDIVFFSWNGNGVADHVEIIEAASKDGLTTVGFNTGPESYSGNQSNGDGVYRRHRPYLYVLAIARPDYAGSSKPASSTATSKKVAAGVAGTATALTGGTAAIHSATTNTTNPAPTKPPTVIVAPPFPGTSAFKVGSKGKAELVVAKALANAGLMPASLVSDTFTQEDAVLVPVYQKLYPGLKKSIGKGIDLATYTSMVAKANA
jgi:CHAP domain